MAETYAASSAVVEMTWIKALWESMTWKDFDILTQRRSSRPLKTTMPHVIGNENPAYYDPESTLVMDSEGLFDELGNGLPQDDRKSVLEVPIIEEFMRRATCRPRWCPHNRNAADAMTKFKGNAFGAVIHVVTHWNVHVERRKIRSWLIEQLFDKLEL